MAQAQKMVFSTTSRNKIKLEKGLHRNFQKCLTPKETNNNKEFLCNEIRRLPNETIKQLAVRIETLVRKAYSLNTHDYKKHKDGQKS